MIVLKDNITKDLIHFLEHCESKKRGFFPVFDLFFPFGDFRLWA